jgi:hypothetical protein
LADHYGGGKDALVFIEETPVEAPQPAQDIAQIKLQDVLGKFKAGAKVVITKIGIKEGQVSKIQAGEGRTGNLLADIKVGRQIFLDGMRTSAIAKIEAKDENTLIIYTETSIYEVTINTPNISVQEESDIEGSQDKSGKKKYTDWSPKTEKFPSEIKEFLNDLDKWDILKELDLKSLPAGTLIYLGDTGTWVNYLVRIEENGMVSLWCNRNDARFIGSGELLQSINQQEGGKITAHTAIGFPYFAWKNGNLIDYNLTSEKFWIQSFPFFRVLYPASSGSLQAQLQISKPENAEVDLSRGAPHSINYSGPIQVILPGNVKLIVYKYEDIPDNHPLKLKLNAVVSYFIIQEGVSGAFKGLREENC